MESEFTYKPVWTLSVNNKKKKPAEINSSRNVDVCGNKGGSVANGSESIFTYGCLEQGGK